MAYKEIVTKAVIAKGKKKYKESYTITVDETPSTILGCWIINHNFEAKEVNERVVINGSFDANVWYSYDNDTKTTVANKRITYKEEERLVTDTKDATNKDIIVRSLKQPTCVSAKENGNDINLEIEKELGIEIVGDTKVKISSVDDGEETWDNLNTEEEIDNVNTDYIDKEIIS